MCIRESNLPISLVTNTKLPGSVETLQNVQIIKKAYKTSILLQPLRSVGAERRQNVSIAVIETKRFRTSGYIQLYVYKLEFNE